MLESFSLLSGNDIPFPSAQLVIHQPTLKEIGLIGETNFFTACGLLTFSKEKYLSDKDRADLIDCSDFQILMILIKNNALEIKKQKNCMLMLLTLLFPKYQITFEDNGIILKNDVGIYSINSLNFNEFKEIIIQMFCLNQNDEQNYRPANKTAQKIMDKIISGRKKINQYKGNKKSSIFSRYISTLAVGERKDMNDFLNYTVYQLFDEFNRFMLKENADRYIQAVLAGGGKGLKEPENWFKDLYE